jgi:phosphopantothenoylcysteine decarboxylase/phosphopantothenate--cysteine ligase
LKKNISLHPSKRISGTISNRLQGKKVVLGITGSIAAFKAPEIARELIRLGADVIPVMSEAASQMIGEDLMWWATGNKPITKVTGRLEHISLAGVMDTPADIFLIAPCTTNTIAKLATGIADTPVTLIASSLHGKGIPIMVLGVAHEDLINSPSVQNALGILQKQGIYIIEPEYLEGKAKVPDLQEIIFEVLTVLTPKTLQDKTVIVSGGPTREYIDNVRFISNSSSGRTGVEIAKEAYMHGADVWLVLGPSSISIPRKINIERVNSSQEMANAMLEKIKLHPNSTVVLSAAMADFTPKDIKMGKIKSGKEMSIDLVPTSKLSDQIKPQFPKCNLILFKAEWGLKKDELIERAKNKLLQCDAEGIIANDLSKPDVGFEVATNHVFFISKEGKVEELQESKSNLARIIISKL